MPTIQRGKSAHLQHLDLCSSRESPSSISNSHSPLLLKAEILPQFNGELSISSERSIRNTFYSYFQSLQRVIARLFVADPEFTQAKVFRFLAPIVVFLALLSTLVAVNRRRASSGYTRLIDVSWDSDGETTPDSMLAYLGFLCIVVAVIITGTLAALWLLTYVAARCIRYFMEWDFSVGKTRTSGGRLDSIMGGLFTH